MPRPLFFYQINSYCTWNLFLISSLYIPEWATFSLKQAYQECYSYCTRLRWSRVPCLIHC